MTLVVKVEYISKIHGFLLGFLVKKIPKNDKIKKDHPINLDKSIWTCHATW